jgi:poly-beta-1,6-N-acetyl-D-glucosamine synthase
VAGRLEGAPAGALLFPELCYAMFLNVVYVKGVWDLSLARQATWKHVVQPDHTSRSTVSS